MSILLAGLFSLDVSALNRKGSGVEVMQGFSTDFFTTNTSSLGLVDPWEYDMTDLNPSGSDGVYGTVEAIDLGSKDAAADGVTKFYFRTRQTNDNAQATTRLSGFDGTDDYELLPFTLNTGLITVDGTTPDIKSFTATQVQTFAGSVDVFGDALTYQGTVTFAVDVFDAPAGIDTNDVVCTVTHVATTSETTAVQTGTSSTTEVGWTRYTFTVLIDDDSPTGVYSVSVDATDRSGNISELLTGTFEFVRRVEVTVQLQGAVAGLFTNEVTFLATDVSGAVLAGWTNTVEFTDGIGMAIIDDVSVDMASLSAKTGFSLRRRITAYLDGEGQGSVSFIGTGVGGNQLLGGDLNDDNVVNMIDFNRLRYYWYTDNDVADIDGDGYSAVGDLNILKANWYVTGDLQ